MTRRSKILVAFGAAALAVVVAIVLFDWNMLRGQAARYVSQKTGRTFAIQGNFNVKLSRVPLIEMHDVVLGNSSWGTQPRMAEVARIAFRIDLGELLKGRVVLPYLELREPVILLETNTKNIGNWQFSQSPGNSGAAPTIGELRIDKGRVGYRPSDRQTAINVTVSSEWAKDKSLIRFSGEGFLRNEPFNLEGDGANLLSLTQGGSSYRINVLATAGSSQASFDGTFVPFKLETIDGQLKLNGKICPTYIP